MLYTVLNVSSYDFADERNPERRVKGNTIQFHTGIDQDTGDFRGVRVERCGCSDLAAAKIKQSGPGRYDLTLGLRGGKGFVEDAEAQRATAKAS